MNLAIVSDIATMIFCTAVLIQTVRLMRCLAVVRGGELTGMVRALDASTAEARKVLGRLTELLDRDLAVTVRTLDESKSMLDELTVMTGIANAIAERIVDVSGATGHAAADAPRADAVA